MLFIDKINKSGFTLIEINLVLLIVGVALVSLMGLFPVGLREADAAASDTEQAMFAERLLSTVQAKANSMTNAVTWDNESTFINKLNISLLNAVKSSYTSKSIEIGTTKTLSNYPDEKKFMKYKLVVKKVTPRDMGITVDDDKFIRLYRATVWVSNRKAGDLDNNTPYSTYLFYKGVP